MEPAVHTWQLWGHSLPGQQVWNQRLGKAGPHDHSPCSFSSTIAKLFSKAVCACSKLSCDWQWS